MIAELDKMLDKLERPKITIDDLVQWKHHPVTKRLCHDFLMAYSDELEFLSTNVPCDDEARATHAVIVGKLEVYKTFLDYVEDVKAELKGSENDD